MTKFILLLALSTVFASFPLMAADAAARREAARLAAQKAEEATRRANQSAPGQATAADSGPVQPAAKPPAVDETHVEIVSEKDVALHGAGDLIGNRYRLREIDGEKLAGDADAFVEWRSGTDMAGKLCNLFRAESSFENTVVKAEQLPAMTKMACTDETMGKAEERFFAAIKLGMSFVAIGDSLEMRRDDLVLRFTLEKKEAAAAPEAEETPEEPAAGEEAPAVPPADASAEAEASASESSEPAVSDAVAVEADLVDRKFVLSKVDGEAFSTTGKQPFIEFGEGMRVGGSACNTFTGLGSLTGGTLVVANAVATRMMCFDPKVSEFEKYFHQMLREGVDVAVKGATLTLTGGGRTLEFVEEE